MKNKIVKQWIAIITLSCVLTGYIVYDNLAMFHPSNSTHISSTVTPEEQQKL